MPDQRRTGRVCEGVHNVRALTDIDIAYWRMHNLGLLDTRFETAEEVVRWLGAVQSQDYGPAKWSIGQRTDALRDTDVDTAFAEGRLLRTHVLRSTWHFVLPEDIRWIQALTGPRVHAQNAFMYRQLELGEDVRSQTEAVIVRALHDGKQLTRSELATELQSHGIEAQGQRLGYILMSAELNGSICSGRVQGKQHTYALLKKAPSAQALTRDEALAKLTLRYFTSHGPATINDFKWWSSLTLAEIKIGLALVGHGLEHDTVDGSTYWFAAPPPTTKPKPAVLLIQGYDEYTVGFSESKYVLDTAGARLRLGDRPIFNLVVLLDSQIAGCWKRTVTKEAVLIEAALYRPFDTSQLEALESAAQEHADFLGLRCHLEHHPL
jgi:hypothetical protein